MPIILVEQRKLSRNDTDSFPGKMSDILVQQKKLSKQTTQTAFQARCQSFLLSRDGLTGRLHTETASRLGANHPS